MGLVVFSVNVVAEVYAGIKLMLGQLCSGVLVIVIALRWVATAMATMALCRGILFAFSCFFRALDVFECVGPRTCSFGNCMQWRHRKVHV